MTGAQRKNQPDTLAAANDNRLFPIVLPSEAIHRPPPVYWDMDELFLRSNYGSVSMIYADYSNCKTTFAVCRAIAVAKQHDARVLYIVAEGVGFLGPLTLLGAMLDWNNTHPDDPIDETWLDGHLHLIEVAPRIIGSGDLAALKKEVADWQPNLVYIDTLGASAAGQNLGLIEVGTEIGKKLRQFSQECEQAPYVSDVVFLHHIGKDDSKGATGSRYFMNDRDQALELSYLQKDGLLEVEVTKARSGEKGRKVMFGVRKLKLPNKAEIVAVYPLAKEDPRSQPPKPESKRDREADQVYQCLKHHFGSPGTVVTQAELLDRLVVREQGEGEQQFKDRREDWRKNKLPRLAWQKGRRGSGKSGPIFGLLHGVALENPARPRQPYTFEVPRELPRI